MYKLKKIYLIAIFSLFAFYAFILKLVLDPKVHAIYRMYYLQRSSNTCPHEVKQLHSLEVDMNYSWPTAPVILEGFVETPYKIVVQDLNPKIFFRINPQNLHNLTNINLQMDEMPQLNLLQSVQLNLISVPFQLIFNDLTPTLKIDISSVPFAQQFVLSFTFFGENVRVLSTWSFTNLNIFSAIGAHSI